MQKDIFWATPAVFWPQSEAWVAEQKHFLQTLAPEWGLRINMLSPIDTALENNSIDASAIFLSNVAMLTQADAVIADVSPFRSLEPDVGTALLIGMATQLNKPVFLYSDSAKVTLQAAYQSQADAQGYVAFKGKPTQVEDFGHPVNLMLMYDKDGNTRSVYASVEEALQAYVLGLKI